MAVLFICLLAQGYLGKNVAKELNVTPQTVSEWQKSPAFVACLNRLKEESLESARASLQNSTTIAAKALADIAQNSKTDESRRKAAMDILGLCGFEPGKHETYSWGIGGTTEAKVQAEMDKSGFDISSLLKEYL